MLKLSAEEAQQLYEYFRLRNAKDETLEETKAALEVLIGQSVIIEANTSKKSKNGRAKSRV